MKKITMSLLKGCNWLLGGLLVEAGIWGKRQKM